MKNDFQSHPTRLPVLAETRSGQHRRFPAVSPFVRMHLALRRLAIEEADTRAHKRSEASTLAFLEDIRRATDVRASA